MNSEFLYNIYQIADGCRFNDCSHDGDEGCAVTAALESGKLEERRFRSFKKLVEEQARNSRSLAAQRELRTQDREDVQSDPGRETSSTPRAVNGHAPARSKKGHGQVKAFAVSFFLYALVFAWPQHCIDAGRFAPGEPQFLAKITVAQPGGFAPQ